VQELITLIKEPEHLAREVIEDRVFGAAEVQIWVTRDDAGVARGFFALQGFVREMRAGRTLILKAHAGDARRRVMRPGSAPVRRAVVHGARLMWRYRCSRAALIAFAADDDVYSRLAELAQDKLWPRFGEITPAEITRVMRSLAEAYGEGGPRGEKTIWVPLSFDMLHRLVRRGVGWLGPVMPIDPAGSPQGI